MAWISLKTRNGRGRALTLLAAVWIMAAAVEVAPALATPAVANVRSICVDHAAEKERAERIPRGLVQAVALAESGRWLRQDNSTRPWPWTVTSGSDSFYLASKSEAIAKVEELQASGRTNIDVGCMQINLHYHPDAFATLEEAFDPVQNIAYGTKFLKDLRHQTRSWGKATAYYHSQNRDRGRAYRDKVYKLWRKLRRRPTALSAETSAAASGAATAAATAIEKPARSGGKRLLFKDKVRRPFISRRAKPLWRRDAIPILRGG